MSEDVAAFFDMDHTLVLCNTGRLYVHELKQRGEIGWREVLRMTAVMARYKLALVDMPAVMRGAVRALEGVPEDRLRERCESLFERTIKGRVSQQARAVVEEHRALGHRLVVLSAQTPYMVAPLCRHLGIDDQLSSELEVVDGVFTGAMVAPVCYGDGKVARAEAYASRHGLELERCWFYTDSYSDLPMLEAVENPRVVNPDPRLRLHARRQRWPVLHFET